MIYLASPHNHDDPAIRDWRYEMAMECTARLLNEGKFVYSPIVHCHAMAIKHELPHGFDFWKAFDLHMIDLAEAVYVLQIDGWFESRGVTAEIEYAQGKGIPIVYTLP